MRRRRARPEDVIQRAVFAHIAARSVAGVVAFHPFNGGYRKPIEAAISKGLGVLAGIPDVIVFARGEAFALELKAEGGTLTAVQSDVLARLELAGVHVAVAYGIDAAIRQLEAWQLLRGAAATRAADPWGEMWAKPFERRDLIEPQESK